MKHQTPEFPKESSEPTQYHSMDSCNACGEENELINPAYDERGVYETKTTCCECGHNDYWAYGFFESGSEVESKCKKYSFGN